MPEANHADPQPEKKAELKSSLNLPETAFPMKANLPQSEPARLQLWHADNLYQQIRAARAGSPKYILHDGPPYANGAIHLGHALNKCLKDFVVKTKTMAGFDAPYVPGWDCHGLPIEIKVDEQLGRKKLEMDPVAVRRACREYAQEYLDLQREQFKRLGIFGRWDRPYSTMDKEYEARIIETFYVFFERGFVYKGLKPVYWCMHDQTALAEAEVEYEQHTSPSIYVRYALKSDPASIDASLAGKKVFTIIWTTTPWTLPASMAVAFHPEFDYIALQNSDGNVYIINAALAASTQAACNLNDAKIIVLFKGSALEHTVFAHPFLNRDILGVNANYVTTDLGTGVVHTAPAHGVDDFQTGERYQLSVTFYVDNSGRQMYTDGMPYEGLNIFKSNAVIIEILKEKSALLGLSEITHSYPHCWRCHRPVIIRATEQWFIGMDTKMSAPGGTPSTFRQRALDEINNVTWDPAWGKDRITNMVATRPDWCISRQRIWGVPIAVFLCQQCHTPINNNVINKSIVDLFMLHSADAWYTHDVAALLPAGTKCAQCAGTDFRKETDILDVWFESGASSHAVMDFDADVPPPADLYAEGGDQHRGWFMSSLLCSIGMHNRAPYKSVATYGWTIDENGKALSKSMGSSISGEITEKLGAEIVRLWVASVDFREDVVASLPLLKRLAEEIYRKLRNTFRFLLGNLKGFDPATDCVPFEQMQPLDQYMLAKTADLTTKIRVAYDEFEFHRVYHALNEFCNSDLSAFYLDVLKDRMYTFAPKDPARRSAQTAVWKITDALVRLIAPILSFTADEVWQNLPKLPSAPSSVHLTLFPKPEDLVTEETVALTADWELLLKFRIYVLSLLEQNRSAKEIGKSREAAVTILRVDDGNKNMYDALVKYEEALDELFNVSKVSFLQARTSGSSEPSGNSITAHVEPATDTKCNRCWRYTTDVGSDLRWPTVCARCAHALDAINFPALTT
jgi:isoleucyl-tRNA synthetase